jgi:predicted nucleic acid-binding protein
VNLFLDTSVLLAAVGSPSGASREIFRRGTGNGWVLITTHYVLREIERNIGKLPLAAASEWARLSLALVVRRDILTLDRIVVFGPAKDRPILFSAFAYADVLLTLDREDFGGLMDKPFYGLMVQRPGMFLEMERAVGRLR